MINLTENIEQEVNNFFGRWPLVLVAIYALIKTVAEPFLEKKFGENEQKKQSSTNIKPISPLGKKS